MTNRRVGTSGVRLLLAAGHAPSSIAAEVLLLLPEDFVRAYEGLYTDMIGVKRDDNPDSARSSAKRAVRVSTGQEPQMNTVGGAGGRGFGPRSPVSSDEAQSIKSRVDRKLRKIARELTKGERSNPRRCTGKNCRKWAEPDWVWCPYCKAATEDLVTEKRNSA